MIGYFVLVKRHFLTTVVNLFMEVILYVHCTIFFIIIVFMNLDLRGNDRILA